MRKIFSILVLFVIVLSVNALPARRDTLRVTLPDGTTVLARAVGDEFSHYLVNVETGEVISQNKGSKLAAQKRASAELRRKARANKMRKVAGYKGSKKGLIILVQFQDVKFQSGHTQALFNDFANKVGYSESGAIGSVHDYFYDQSYGQFDLTFDVIGPVTVSENSSYYGANDKTGNDMYPATMVIEACKLANPSVNFKDYDWDGDGEVDQVYVMYAGRNESSTMKSTDIWPHEFWLSEAKRYGDGTGALYLDGVTIDTYACSGELNGATGTRVSGIGACCHEFSHCLGLPDFYDTTVSGSNFGMSNWSLMDYGSYNESQAVPCGYTCYERWFCGWLTPTVLDEGCTVTDMPALVDEAAGYIIYNENHPDEFYTLENRQKKSWDRGLDGHGMLVVHVDYDEDAWWENTVNDDASHQRCTPICADNIASDYTLSGDPYPGTSGNTALTNTTKPAATLFNINTDNKKFMNRPIEEITEKNGLISFVFNGGLSLEAPVATDATNVSAGAFTANWNAVDEAVKYDVELSMTKEEGGGNPADYLLLSQDMTKLTPKTAGLDVASTLDDYMDVKGWTGKKLYFENQHMKFGSSSETGYLKTPSVDVQEGAMTVQFTAQPFASGSIVKLTVSLSGPSNAELTANLAGSQTVTLNFNGLKNGNYTVTFTPSGKDTKTSRLYLDNVAVYDGEWTAEDLQTKAASPLKRKVTKVVLYEDIVGTSYAFEGLDASYAFSYRVRAKGGNGEMSKWSESVQVPFVTGVNTVSTKPTRVIRYDLFGRRTNATHGLFIENGRKVLR